MLSIIIPTRNKATRLRVCLRTLCAETNGLSVPVEIIVVDDGSDNETARLPADATAAGSVRILRHPMPGGRSAARNTGAAAARGERLLFLDDDMLIGRAALERHAALARSATPCLGRATILGLPWLRSLPDPTRSEMGGRLAGRCLPAAGPVLPYAAALARRSPFEARLHDLLALRPFPQPGRWLAATGGNLSVNRALFQALGGFDPHLGLRWGVEDLEFGYRAEQAGAPLVHLADVAAYHMDHPAHDRAADHALALSYFAQKHGADLGARLQAFFVGAL